MARIPLDLGVIAADRGFGELVISMSGVWVMRVRSGARMSRRGTSIE